MMMISLLYNVTRETYRVQNQNRSELADDDKFIVSRNGDLYYVNAEDVGGGTLAPID